MGMSLEMTDQPAPWGSRQPKFDRLVCDGPGLYFLVYRLPSGKEVRVQLSAPRSAPNFNGGIEEECIS